MKMTLSESIDAVNRSIDGPNQPNPISCGNCEDEYMEYDDENRIYTCPICGETVAEDDVYEYILDSIRKEEI